MKSRQTQWMFLILGVSLVGLSGCLKTRAQLRSDNPSVLSASPSTSTPSRVEPVYGQGGYVIDELKVEIARLTGRIDELERSQQQSTTQGAAGAAATSSALDTRLNELEADRTRMMEAIKRLQDNLPPPDPDADLERGRKEFQSKNYSAAITTLTKYLRTPGVKKIEEGTFLRAEAYFEQKEFKKAIIDYSQFPEKFTQSKLLPAALYKIGLSFDALGMKNEAKAFYQELQDRHPRSAEAKKLQPKPATAKKAPPKRPAAKKPAESAPATPKKN